MADRVFQITEVLLLKYFALNVLPGAMIKSQMAHSEVRKPKKLLHSRIRVQLVISLIKSYRCSKSILPIAVLHSCDDIIHNCAGLCNLNFYNNVIITFYAFLQEVII